MILSHNLLIPWQYLSYLFFQYFYYILGNVISKTKIFNVNIGESELKYTIHDDYPIMAMAEAGLGISSCLFII